MGSTELLERVAEAARRRGLKAEVVKNAHGEPWLNVYDEPGVGHAIGFWPSEADAQGFVSSLTLFLFERTPVQMAADLSVWADHLAELRRAAS